MTSSVGYNDCVLGKGGTLSISLRRPEISNKYLLYEIRDLAQQMLSSSKSYQGEEDDHKREEARQRGEDGLVLSNLHRTVLLADGVTLRDFFMMLTRYSILQQLNMLILPFMKEFERAPADGCTLPEVKQLTFDSYVKVDWDGHFIREMTIRGDYGAPRNAVSSESTFLLDFCPLANLLDMPVVINKSCEVTICPKGKDPREEGASATHHESIFRGPTLHEFVYAITDELAEYGSPEGRERFRDSLGNMIQRLEEGEEAEE